MCSFHCILKGLRDVENFALNSCVMADRLSCSKCSRFDRETTRIYHVSCIDSVRISFVAIPK